VKVSLALFPPVIQGVIERLDHFVVIPRKIAEIKILKGSNLSITMGATHGLTNTNRNHKTPAGV